EILKIHGLAVRLPDPPKEDCRMARSIDMSIAKACIPNQQAIAAGHPIPKLPDRLRPVPRARWQLIMRLSVSTAGSYRTRAAVRSVILVWIVPPLVSSRLMCWKCTGQCPRLGHIPRIAGTPNKQLPRMLNSPDAFW